MCRLWRQIENEYGKYGKDKQYLRHLQQRLTAGGLSELLFTCDYADSAELAAGALEGMLQAVNFGCSQLSKCHALQCNLRTRLQNTVYSNVSVARQDMHEPLAVTYSETFVASAEASVCCVLCLPPGPTSAPRPMLPWSCWPGPRRLITRTPQGRGGTKGGRGTPSPSW